MYFYSTVEIRCWILGNLNVQSVSREMLKRYIEIFDFDDLFDIVGFKQSFLFNALYFDISVEDHRRFYAISFWGASQFISYFFQFKHT